MKRKSPLISILNAILLFVLLIWVISYLEKSSTQEISYTTLMSKIENSEVESVLISYDRTQATVVYKDDTTKRIVDLPSSSAFMEAVEAKIASGEFDLVVEQQSGFMVFLEMLPTICTIVLMVVILFVLFKQMSGANNQVMNFGRSRAQLISPTAKKVTFENVAGLKEEKEELIEKCLKKYANIHWIRW